MNRCVRSEGLLDSISEWLARVGLAQYTATFTANDLDVLTAAKLTDADLKELGVAALGHRKRLLDAISALRETPRASTALERRFVTVMFCDLVDSVALSVRLDPEELATVIAGYQERCARSIEQFGGKVARYVGDGVLSYFGHPRAHEDSAERAVRAALQIVGAFSGAASPTLKVRIGIATGPVVIGDLPGSDAVERNAVVGETPNLAARLQQAAKPNSIVISEKTHRQVAAHFQCIELPPAQLKGMASIVQTWQVTGERAFAGRFEARRVAGLSPFVGREEELQLLEAHWRAVETGAGRVVTLAGEPGIGKSRLVEELALRLGENCRHRVDLFGSPFLQASPLSPILNHLSRAAGFAPGDTAGEKRGKLEAVVATYSGLETGGAALFASLLSLPAASQDPPLDRDSPRQKRQILGAITNWIASLALRGPVLIVCEDVHWFDRASLEALDKLCERLPSVPILIVCTARPGFLPAWRARPAAHAMALDKLDPARACELLELVARGADDLAPESKERIVQRSDGSPLYIEELTRAVLTLGRDVPGRPNAAVPETLQDLLVARLDAAGAEMEVVQIGAAIGREFPLQLLEAVAGGNPAERRASLDRLVSSEVLHCTGSAAGVTYAFMHALLRDAAYETMLHSRRREIHRRIAESIESAFHETVETQPELLAQHWENAGVPETAIRYWITAAKRAASRSADLDADAHLRRALALVDLLPAGAGRDRIELEMRVLHGGILRALLGPPADQTGMAFVRACELSRTLGESEHRPAALAGLYAYQFVRAENTLAAATAEELLALGRTAQDRRCLMNGYRMVGMVQVHTGRLASARANLEQALALYDEAVDDKLAFVFGTDPLQTTAGFLAKALWLLGRPESAEALEDRASRRASQVHHVFSLVQGCMFRTTVRMAAREWATAAAIAQETRVLATRYSLRFALAFSDFCIAAAHSFDQPGARAVQAMRAAADAWGPLNYRPWYLGLIAEAQARAGDPAGGLHTLQEARQLVRTTNERWVEPELVRVSGELNLIRDGATSAEAGVAFSEAMTLARGQGARSWELRAALSLGRLLQLRGQAHEARALITPILASFTEGFDTPDLKDAAALLQGG